MMLSGSFGTSFLLCTVTKSIGIGISGLIIWIRPKRTIYGHPSSFSSNPPLLLELPAQIRCPTACLCRNVHLFFCLGIFPAIVFELLHGELPYRPAQSNMLARKEQAEYLMDWTVCRFHLGYSSGDVLCKPTRSISNTFISAHMHD